MNQKTAVSQETYFLALTQRFSQASEKSAAWPAIYHAKNLQWMQAVENELRAFVKTGPAPQEFMEKMQARTVKDQQKVLFNQLSEALHMRIVTALLNYAQSSDVEYLEAAEEDLELLYSAQ